MTFILLLASAMLHWNCSVRNSNEKQKTLKMTCKSAFLYGCIIANVLAQDLTEIHSSPVLWGGDKSAKVNF